jgi:hypothetical protein
MLRNACVRAPPKLSVEPRLSLALRLSVVIEEFAEPDVIVASQSSYSCVVLLSESDEPDAVLVLDELASLSVRPKLQFSDFCQTISSPTTTGIVRPGFGTERSMSLRIASFAIRAASSSERPPKTILE